jgi:hypothetical protein
VLSPHAVNKTGYTDVQIDDALRGIGASPKISFRYGLLDGRGVKMGELDGVGGGRISFDGARATKRVGDFTLSENGQKNVKEINFLRDRLNPWFILHMPGGGTVEWPLGVFLMDAPERATNGGDVRLNMCLTAW